MCREDEAIEILNGLIDKKRIRHSMSVSRTAGELAKHYGVNIKQARLAGLIHDCAKCLSYEEMMELCDEHGLVLDNLSLGDRALMHGPLGALMAKKLFGIEDQTILDAIECHTTGKKGMTLFDKIVCLADYIEPGRQYADVEQIRKFAYKDINIALLKGLELSIRSVLDSAKVLHPCTVEARNEIIMELSKNE